MTDARLQTVTSGFWTADRRLWLTAGDTDEFGHTARGDTVVEDGDPDARFLLCSPGDEVPMSVITDLGLLERLDEFDAAAAAAEAEANPPNADGEPAAGDGDAKAEAPAEDKAEAPAEDKAAKPAAKGKGKK